MSAVNLTNVVVLDNPTAFTNPFQFEVTFECLQELDDDLEWRVTYVGSAEDENKDQVLEEVLVGPVPMGVNRFVLQADAPNAALIPREDVLGVTVVLLTCLFRKQEFVRIGYYVNNEIPGQQPAEDGAVPPFDGDVGKVQRSILHDKPRITRFPIDWQPLQPGHSENVPASTSAPSVGGGMEAGMMEVDGNSVDGLPQAQAAMQPPPSFGSGAAALEASYEAAGAAAIAAAPPMAPMGAMAMSMS